MKLQPDSYVAPADSIRAAFAGASSDDVTFLARQCLEIGAWDHALAICDALGDADAPAVTLCRAVATFVAGDGDHALAIVDDLLVRKPNHLSALVVKAQMLVRRGQRAQALPLLLEVTTRYPDYPGAQGLLATLLMPGPHYRDVLARMHERLDPATYVEIGVDTGATLALARRARVAIGIDPEEVPLQHALTPATRLFRLTSDAFFAQHSRQSLLGAARVDLGFIDGLHRFEAALRDFANLEAWSHASATLVLHDCVPLLARSAARQRATKFWVGDTWKVVRALRVYRPDLRIRTLLTPPSGLTVVRCLNPDSTLIHDRFSEIVARFMDDRWDAEPGAYMPELGCVANDEAGLADVLS
ncbi:MAG TPA: class I SAM-dependent methyltransferase [Polyangiaceae bacterium]|nr:class I SAM-dependent methyltransferase [Polyangiaceae bacterium]